MIKIQRNPLDSGTTLAALCSFGRMRRHYPEGCCQSRSMAAWTNDDEKCLPQNIDHSSMLGH
jgi:hypothetical protein